MRMSYLQPKFTKSALNVSLILDKQRTRVDLRSSSSSCVIANRTLVGWFLDHNPSKCEPAKLGTKSYRNLRKIRASMGHRPQGIAAKTSPAFM